MGDGASGFDILAALADLVQQVEPVHDLVHVDVIGQLVDGLQGFLSSELHGGLPEYLASVKRLGPPKAVSLVCLLCSAIMPSITRKGQVRQDADHVLAVGDFGQIDRTLATMIRSSGSNMSQGASDIPTLDPSSGPAVLDPNTAYPPGYLASIEDRWVILPILTP